LVTTKLQQVSGASTDRVNALRYMHVNQGEQRIYLLRPRFGRKVGVASSLDVDRLTQGTNGLVFVDYGPDLPSVGSTPLGNGTFVRDRGRIMGASGQQADY